MTIREAMEIFRASFPSYYMIAEEHTFGCYCTPCVCFADDCIRYQDQDDMWKNFLDEELVNDQLSPAQITQFGFLINYLD